MWAESNRYFVSHTPTLFLMHKQSSEALLPIGNTTLFICIHKVLFFISSNHFPPYLHYIQRLIKAKILILILLYCSFPTALNSLAIFCPLIFKFSKNELAFVPLALMSPLPRTFPFGDVSMDYSLVPIRSIIKYRFDYTGSCCLQLSQLRSSVYLLKLLLPWTQCFSLPSQLQFPIPSLLHTYCLGCKIS